MSNITDRLNKVLTTLNSNTITDVALASAKSHTPIRSGNARRKTTKQGTKIQADYPYAKRLEENYSPQTNGKGIIQPTIDDVREYVRQRTGINIKI